MWRNRHIVDLILFLLYTDLADGLKCRRDQFMCKNQNKNQIVSINDFNREKEHCIHQDFRCDGRHDCQDGSDEDDCNFSHLKVNREFRCWTGIDDDIVLEDCISKDLAQRIPDNEFLYRMDHMDIPLSVSESAEWVCTKTDHPNGTTVRSCEKTYTGGENFSTCFYSSSDVPRKCLCSKQMCNHGLGLNGLTSNIALLLAVNLSLTVLLVQLIQTQLVK